MRNLLVLCSLLFFFTSISLQAEEAQQMTLHSRMGITPLNFNLKDSDRRWLREKQEVRIAVYEPDNPPFGMVLEANTYEGISADYSLLVMHHLGLRFQILRYSSKEKALEGLRRGSIDILIDDGGQIEQRAGLLRSIPYMPDRPAVISRETAMSKPLVIPPEARIALVHGFMSDDWVESRYSEAKISRYSSLQSALLSVVFGENDYFIGNLTSPSFLIERNYATELSVADIFLAEDTGPRFVFREKGVVLQRVVNAVLGAFSSSQHKEIFRHWSQGPNPWLFRSRLSLTEQEKRWLAKHNELRVVMNPLYAPFTLFDSQKQFQGITADVLRLIHLRTGLNFRAVKSNTESHMFDMVRQHQGDFVAAINYSQSHDGQLLFTRPYMQPPFVMIVRDLVTAPKTLSEVSTIAMGPGSNFEVWLQEQYPQLKLIEVGNASVAMKMVSDGKADAAIHNLIGAHYMIDRYFRGKLKIATRFGDNTAEISFAVRSDQPELYSILNKALADIPPRDISLIANKWHGTPDVKLDTWAVYRTEFYWLAGIFAVLVMTSLIWNYYLHREIRLRKTAQVCLQEQAAFLETLFNHIPVPVYVVTRNGEMIDCNPAWDHFFSHFPQTIHKIPLTSKQHPLADVWHSLALMFDNPGDRVSPVQRYRLRNGHEESVIAHQAVAFRDNTGRVAGLICCWQDMTEHEQLLADVSSSRERAEQASRYKSTFLATMSHEIRTPVSAIIGLLELAVTSNETRDDSELIRVAYESALSLMGLIGGILDMAKIESGKLELSPAWVRFETLVTPVVRIFDGLACEKGILLENHVDKLHPDEIWIDTMRLHQVLSNLIGNAIKFTEQGRVSIQVSCVPDNDRQATLKLIVADTGVGIPQEEQSTIFNPYVQSEAGKRQSGTGLGLAICNQLLYIMDGNIKLSSQPGHGTQITVCIPVNHRKTSLKQKRGIQEISGIARQLNILAVDDHPANRMLMKRQLIRLGHQVTEAKDGQQALTLWRNNIFDLVITDCNMPVMDGLELARRLRQEQKSSLIILGLTANAQPEERERCLAVGMDDCLFKPLRLPQLDHILNRISRQKRVSKTQILSLGSLVDLQALRVLTQNDEELLHALLIATRDENTHDIQRLQVFLEDKSWGKLSHCFHRLAGAAQIIGANKVETLCRYLEQYCANEPKEDEVTKGFEQVVAIIAELNIAIDAFMYRDRANSQDGKD